MKLKSSLLLYFIFFVSFMTQAEENLDKQISETRDSLATISHNEKVIKMYDETVNLWRDYYSSNRDFDLQTLLRAVFFAAVKHSGQTRKDAEATPYIVHPIGVARSLWEEGGIRSNNVIVAALLHDTLEDTVTTTEEIELNFGARVRSTVEELTNDPTLSSQENKQRQIDHARFLSLDGKLIKLADRLYNIRDLRNPPPSWSKDDIIRYRQWGEKLLNELKGTNENLEKLLKAEIQNQSASSST